MTFRSLEVVVYYDCLSARLRGMLWVIVIITVVIIAKHCCCCRYYCGFVSGEHTGQSLQIEFHESSG